MIHKIQIRDVLKEGSTSEYEGLRLKIVDATNAVIGKAVCDENGDAILEVSESTGSLPFKLFIDNDIYPAPIVSPAIRNWSQNVGVDVNNNPLWGYYWIRGYKVAYAVNFLYSDGKESEMSPWADWVVIGDYALGQIWTPNLPITSPGFPTATGWNLYRMFQVSDGTKTPPVMIGYTDISSAWKVSEGNYILIDQGGSMV